MRESESMAITGKQLFWLISTMQVGMTILLTINPTILVSRQDAWMSSILAGLIGMLVAWVCSRISLLMPGMTLVDYARSLLGSWLGNALIVLYLLQWYSVLAIILRQYSELIVGSALVKTPITVPMLGMLFVAVYAVHSGLTTIARCSQIFGPFILLGIAIPIMLSLRDFDLRNLQPVYHDTGWVTLIKGSLPTGTFLGDCVMLIVLFRFVAKPATGARPAILGVGIAGLLVGAATFLIVGVISAARAAGSTYPYFQLVRYISYTDSFQNLDAIVIALWISGVFIKISLYLFVSAYGTSQLLGVRRWKRSIWIIAPLALGLAYIPRDFIQSSVQFPQNIAIPFILPFYYICMPIVLLGLAKLRQVRRERGRQD